MSKKSEWLKPYHFKKGQSGNPKGRPVGSRGLSKTMSKLVEELCTTVPQIESIAIELGLDPRKTTIGGVLAFKLIFDALHGDGPIAKEVLNRIDGKVADIIQLQEGIEALSDEQLEEELNRIDGMQQAISKAREMRAEFPRKKAVRKKAKRKK